jgi:hypothetical protein
MGDVRRDLEAAERQEKSSVYPGFDRMSKRIKPKPYPDEAELDLFGDHPLEPRPAAQADHKASRGGFIRAMLNVGRAFAAVVVAFEVATKRESRLHRPPGYGLLWFADFFYSRKSVEECLRPTIQDLQEEYTEALAAKRLHKARWVRIRGTWSFLCAASLLTVASVGKQVVKIWKAVG